MSAVTYDLNCNPDDLIKGFEAAGRVIAETQKELALLEKEEKKVEAAARKAEKAAKDQEVNFGKLGTAASALNGPLGQLLMGIDDLGGGMEALDGAFGPTAVTIGITTAAVAAFVLGAGAAVAGLIGLNAAAGEAGTRLDKLGMLTADESLKLEDLREITTASAVATDVLTVSLAGALPASEELSLAYVGLKVSIANALDELAAFHSELDAHAVADASGGLIVLGENANRTWTSFFLGQKTYQLLTQAGEEFTAEVEEQGEVMARVYGPTPEMLDEVAAGHREVEAATRKENAETAKAAAAQKAAANEAAKFTATRNSEEKKWQAAKQKIDSEMLAAEESARKARAAAAEQEATKQKALADKEAAQKKTDLDSYTQAAIASAQQVTSAIAGTFQAADEARIADLDADLAASKTKIDALEDQLHSGRELSDAQRDNIERQIENEKKAQKAIQKERKKAADSARRAAMIEAAINGALAITMCFAQLGPIAGAIAAVGVGAAVAAEEVAISKQKFHDGGSLGADEFNAGGGRTGRAGEEAFVFNQRAREQGAIERAKEMNRTGNVSPSRGGGATETTLIFTDFGRTVSTALVRDRKRPGSPMAVGTDGTSNPFRRR